MKDYLFMLAQADDGETTAPPAESATPAGEATETLTTQDGSTNTTPTEPKKQPGGLDPVTIMMMVLMFLVVYFIMFRGPKKKQQQHKDMLSNMKKGDRVRTIGGIVGNVVDVRDDEVVVKIDEANNTKMRFVRNAIASVIVDEQQKT